MGRTSGRALRALIRHHLTGTIAGFLLLLIVLAALLAPWLATGDPTDMQPMDRLKSPRESGLMGTDVFGRDIWSRILYGARVSLAIGASRCWPPPCWARRSGCSPAIFAAGRITR